MARGSEGWDDPGWDDPPPHFESSAREMRHRLTTIARASQFITSPSSRLTPP